MSQFWEKLLTNGRWRDGQMEEQMKDWKNEQMKEQTKKTNKQIPLFKSNPTKTIKSSIPSGSPSEPLPEVYGLPPSPFPPTRIYLDFPP